MRLDQRMVAEGLVPSRAKAQALIAAGVVRVAGTVASKPSTAAPGPIRIDSDPCPWVSRAGLKLDHALRAFDLVPSGVALDVGASTGGFTQVLLARGAAHVHALDVGHGQLHDDLLADPRVTNHEGLNAREIPHGLIPPVDWITADVSFISLEKALPGAFALANPGATLIALIKPQFEAGRAAIGKGGIVTSPKVHDAVQARIRAFLDDLGWAIQGICTSPIEGGDGNREFLIAARNHP